METFSVLYQLPSKQFFSLAKLTKLTFHIGNSIIIEMDKSLFYYCKNKIRYQPGKSAFISLRFSRKIKDHDEIEGQFIPGQ